ncbi:MAG: hypothetical protein GF411_08305 [Candidatus Lokiarchaeota archaeon]|nr:hypothetical protein [Candidatus Lokiarchaeota archaeon]
MKNEGKGNQTDRILELLADPLTRKILATLMGLNPNLITKTREIIEE